MSGGSIPASKVNLRTIRRVNPTMRGFCSALSAKLVQHSVAGRQGGVLSMPQQSGRGATGDDHASHDQATRREPRVASGQVTKQARGHTCMHGG